MLTAPLAAAFARVALANVTREYPRHLGHLMSRAGEELEPRKLHPAFYGSYDWHSAVHMHWLLVRLLRLDPQKTEIAVVLDRHLSQESIAAELRYFQSPAGRTFERPYGWAWALELQAELLRAGNAKWSSALEPLAAEIGRCMARFVNGAPYPIRAGSHGNTAFACLLALDYARTAEDNALQSEIEKTALRWYGSDRDAPLAYEPSADDFLSPTLVEALLMKRVLRDAEFEAWLKGFLPSTAPLEQLPLVADHADAKQSHLDGLCLSRAWCFFRLGFEQPGRHHLAAGMPHVVGGDYVGEHWLASFAALALGDHP